MKNHFTNAVVVRWQNELYLIYSRYHSLLIFL